jgi:hypothetical protein
MQKDRNAQFMVAEVQEVMMGSGEKPAEPEKKKNTFVYLGKTNNFQILQALPKPKRVLAKFTSPLLEGLDTSIKREALSYKSYRSLKQTVQPAPFTTSVDEPVAESNEI